MAHGREADAYDYLATSKVSELTVAQLEQALENSFLNKSNIEFWKGPITMHRLLEVSRTYPWGLPIPEKSAILSQDGSALGTITIKPTGSEIWEVKAMIGYGLGGAAQTVMNYVTDSGDMRMNGPTTILAAPTGTMYDLNDQAVAPHQLTSSMWLEVEETGGSYGVAVAIAYTVVSL